MSGIPRARLASLSLAALVVATGVAVGPAGPAQAAAPPATVTADPLPTAQIDGVAWTQLVVGDTVYVGGEFTTARPAGAAPGTSTVPRANLLAYRLSTGGLVPTFDPVLNGSVRDLAASADGRTLYVAGQFTSVDSVTRYRVAAFDVATGALLSFRPVVNGSVAALAVTGSQVVIGGSFTSVNGAARAKVAGVDAVTAALRPLEAAVAGGNVHAAVTAPDGASVVIGGTFTSVDGSGSPGYGLARLSTATGDSLPLPVNAVIRDGGTNSGILSLDADATQFYGSGFHYGAGGNLEGAFAADWATGQLVWVEDCHGDTYSVAAAAGAVFSASHKHYCGNTGGFPQTTPWSFHRGTATTRGPVGVATQDYYGYASFTGRPSPAFLAWYPDINAGTYTGKSQGPWSVTGNDSYVVYGGEFTQVEGVPQQGLVRFAVPSLAPRREGPVGGGSLPLRAASDEAGTVRLTWRTSRDPDDETLTYALERSGTAAPLTEVVVTTPFWKPEPLTFVDTGRAAGSSQRYRVVARDGAGNTAASAWVTVTVSSQGTLSAYARRVLDDSPMAYWRLGEPTGSAMRDMTGFLPATASTGVTRGVPGAIAGDPDPATTFDGTTAGTAGSTVVGNAPDTLSVEAWVRTTTTRGGKVVGLGGSPTGRSTGADRHLYLSNDGRPWFGMQDSTLVVVGGPTRVNDGAWHHLVGTYGAGTMRLYVDGTLVGQRSDVRYTRAYWSYWRLGGDRLSPWPNAPTSEHLAGTIDEVAVYTRVLPAATVATHSSLGRSAPANQPPTASFTATPSGLAVAVDGSVSSDPDGTVVGHAWEFGDGATGTGATAAHTYAVAGTYTVALTVTDDDGATARTTRSVVVTAPPPTTVVAQDTFTRTLTTGWGTAETGGAWSAAGSGVGVDGARGVHVAPAGATRRTSLDAVSMTSGDLLVTLAPDRLPVGGNVLVNLQARRTSATTYYGARVVLVPDGSVQLAVTRGNGTPVVGGTVAGLTAAAGTALVVRVQVTGTAPTTVRARVWAAGTPEPTTWRAEVTDATDGLQAAGSVGMSTYLSSSATNGPVTVAFDDLEVRAAG